MWAKEFFHSRTARSAVEAYRSGSEIAPEAKLRRWLACNPLEAEPTIYLFRRTNTPENIAYASAPRGKEIRVAKLAGLFHGDPTRGESLKGQRLEFSSDG